jgi:Trypsin-like peptidase domain
MLLKRIRDEVSKATVTIVAKRGSGVLVPGGLVMTAAHCIDWNCTGSMAAWSGTKPPVEIRAYRGENMHIVPYAVEPCSDVAILGPCDSQTFPEDWEAFDEFCQDTQPVTVSRQNFKHLQEIKVHIYGWKKRWITGNAMQRSPSPLWTYVDTSERVEGGFSGGPIVNEAGALVGICSWSGEGAMPNGRFYASFPRPHLALPTWICNEIFGKASYGG